jgi:hypothetical protein
LDNIIKEEFSSLDSFQSYWQLAESEAKMNIKKLPLTLLLFTIGCSHQEKMLSYYELDSDFSLLDDSVSRQESSVPKEIGGLNRIVNPSSTGLRGIQSTKVDKLTLDKLTFQYGKTSKSPESLDSIYKGFLNKSISFQAFQKISTDWPKVSVDLNIVIFKKHLARLLNGPALIDKLSKTRSKSIILLEESPTYFLYRYNVKSNADLAFIGKLINYSILRPVVVLPSKSSPLRHLLNVPDAVVESYKSMLAASGPKSFVKVLKEGRVSLKLMDELVHYDGKKSLKITLIIDQFKGDKKEMESIVAEKFSKAQIKFIASNEDTITFDITLKSVNDLTKLSYVLNDSINQGSIAI